MPSANPHKHLSPSSATSAASAAAHPIFTRLTTYLLLNATLAFALGIGLAAILPPLGIASYVISIATGLTALLLHHRKQRKGCLLFLLLLAVALGRLHGGLALQEPPQDQHIYNLISAEQEVVLQATLIEMPVFDQDKTRLLVKTQALRIKDNPDFIPTHGRVLFSIKGPPPEAIGPGDQLLIRAKLARPYRMGNSGSFDYQTFLRRDDIWITGRIISPLHIHRLQNEPTLGHTLRYLPEQLRGRIGLALDQHLAPEIAAVYRAILIGDRQQISPETLEQFKGSGCMHILAISGLHLSILAGVLFLIFHFLLRRSEYLMLHYPVRKWAGLLTLPPLIFYCLLAGANIPVLRSLLMVCVFILALCSEQRKSLFTTLALAALLILIWRPDSLFTVSFQLSFAAVAAIGTIVPFLKDILQTGKDSAPQSTTDKPGTVNSTINRTINHTGRWILAGLMVSTAATIGTAPLLLSAFNRISLVGPMANLLLEPLLCLWSLPLGFLAIILLPVAPTISVLLLQAGGWGIDLALKLAQFFSQLPLSSVWLPTPAPLLVICYFIALFACLQYRPGHRIALKTRLGLLALIMVLFIFPPQLFFKQFQKGSQLTFLDVGQGSATVLSLPGNKQFLIDGGGAFSPRFNVGERIIAPFLWQQSIRRLEGIAITHPDSDHFNGIPFILAHFRPKTLWINGPDPDDPAYQHLIRQARNSGIQVRIPRPNERLFEEKNAVLTNIANPLNPLSGGDLPAASNSNDRGLILRFQHERLSCLFPGDITGTVEEQLLLHQRAQLPATILLAAHHGSATSNSAPFIKAVAPKTMVVSAGRFKPNHFPSSDLRRLSHTLTIPLLLTADDGAITIDNELKISTFNGAPLPDLRP